ncbi:unnamed protein product [Amoebophrya sp. A120]|nr:unnamed protein product [Amoebophrya sp. A120]|eukprot:GSA120T00005087001.1
MTKNSSDVFPVAVEEEDNLSPPSAGKVAAETSTSPSRPTATGNLPSVAVDMVPVNLNTSRGPVWKNKGYRGAEDTRRKKMESDDEEVDDSSDVDSSSSDESIYGAESDVLWRNPGMMSDASIGVARRRGRDYELHAGDFSSRSPTKHLKSSAIGTGKGSGQGITKLKLAQGEQGEGDALKYQTEKLCEKQLRIDASGPGALASSSTSRGVLKNPSYATSGIKSKMRSRGIDEISNLGNESPTASVATVYSNPAQQNQKPYTGTGSNYAPASFSFKDIAGGASSSSSREKPTSGISVTDNLNFFSSASGVAAASTATGPSSGTSSKTTLVPHSQTSKEPLTQSCDLQVRGGAATYDLQGTNNASSSVFSSSSHSSKTNSKQTVELLQSQNVEVEDTLQQPGTSSGGKPVEDEHALSSRADPSSSSSTSANISGITGSTTLQQLLAASGAAAGSSDLASAAATGMSTMAGGGYFPANSTLLHPAFVRSAVSSKNNRSASYDSSVCTNHLNPALGRRRGRTPNNYLANHAGPPGLSTNNFATGGATRLTGSREQDLGAARKRSPRQESVFRFPRASSKDPIEGKGVKIGGAVDYLPTRRIRSSERWLRRVMSQDSRSLLPLHDRAKRLRENSETQNLSPGTRRKYRENGAEFFRRNANNNSSSQKSTAGDDEDVTSSSDSLSSDSSSSFSDEESETTSSDDEAAYYGGQMNSKGSTKSVARGGSFATTPTNAANKTFAPNSRAGFSAGAAQRFPVCCPSKDCLENLFRTASSAWGRSRS